MKSNEYEIKTTSNTLANTWVMKITADRRIEVNEDVEVTEAAKKVLEAMQRMFGTQIKELERDAARYREVREWDFCGYDHGLISPESVDRAVDDARGQE
jgi:hypothetical protein